MKVGVGSVKGKGRGGKLFVCVCVGAFTCRGTVHLLAPQRGLTAGGPDTPAGGGSGVGGGSSSGFRGGRRAQCRRAQDFDRLGRRARLRRLRHRLRRAQHGQAGVRRLRRRGRWAVVEEDGLDGHLRPRTAYVLACVREWDERDRLRCACVCVCLAYTLVCVHVQVYMSVCLSAHNLRTGSPPLISPSFLPPSSPPFKGRARSLDLFATFTRPIMRHATGSLSLLVIPVRT